MEHNFQALTELLQTVEQLSPSQMEDEETTEKIQLAAQKTFVLRELLTVAMLADYGDETGRRKMFSLLRKS
jgi:condensin complex subunit 3